MNTKLKLALIRRYSDQGFAMPIVIGLGLIMLLIAAMMIMRSQGDQTTALAQKATANSLSTSETGVTRVQSLLNTWRMLPTVTLANIGTSSSTWKQAYDTSPASVCNTSTSNPIDGYRVNDWVTLANGNKFKIIEYKYKPDPYKFPDGSDSPRDSAQISGVSGGNVTIPASARGTVVITSPTNYLASDNSVIGHIKGIQGTLYNNSGTYTFKRRYPTTADTTLTSTETFYPNKVPGVGTLKLEGEISSGMKAANALEVSIPINEVPRRAIQFPGLWVAQGAIPNNNEINGNLLVSGCNANIGGTITGTGHRRLPPNPDISLPDLPTKIRNPRTTLSLPAIASSVTDSLLTVSTATGFNIGDRLKVGDDSNVYAIQSIDTSLNTITIRKVSGSAVITAQASGRVVRLFNDLGNIKGGGTCNEEQGDTCIGTLTLPRGSDTEDADGVYRYSVTSVDIGGRNEIHITPGKKVTFYLSGDMHIQSEIEHNCAAGACNATDFQIYGYGTVNDSHTIGSGVSAQAVSHVCINGSGATYGFLLAPEYTVGVAGAGGSAGFIGSVWVKQWNPLPGGISSCGSSSSNTVVTQAGDWDALEPALAPYTLPKLGSISSWQRQEASP